jgi:hypothetical protein
MKVCVPQCRTRLKTPGHAGEPPGGLPQQYRLSRHTDDQAPSRGLVSVPESRGQCRNAFKIVWLPGRG